MRTKRRLIPVQRFEPKVPRLRPLNTRTITARAILTAFTAVQIYILQQVHQLLPSHL